MSLFRYEAVDKTGKVLRGVMDASNEQTVTQKLSAMGYNARSVYNAAQQAPSRPTQTSAVAPQPTQQRGVGMSAVTLANGVPISIKSCVPASALAVFFRQLATLVKAGHPLYQASTYIRVSNPRIREFLPIMQEKVQSGQKLSGAMAEFPKMFPVHAIASVWCGELAGKLDIVLEEIATDFENEARDTRLGRFGWAIAKATIILFILISPLLDFNALLGKVAGRGLDTALKTFFSGLMSALPVVIALLVFLEIWGYIKRVPVVRHAMDGMLLGAPVWGKLQRFDATAKFFHVLDLLISAGISPATAWDAASLTPKNSEIAKRLKSARNESPVDAGVVAMLERSHVFEMDDIGLATAGEKSGSLPEAAANMASMYTNRAAAQKTMGRFWSITLILILNGALTVLAVYMMAKGYAAFLDPLIKATEF